MGAAFGNAVKVVADLYSANLLEFTDPVNWQDEIVNEATVLTRAIVTAQEALGNELGLEDRQYGNRGGNKSYQKSSPAGSTSTSGTDNDPDATPYTPSADGATPGQIKFLTALLSERGMDIGQYIGLLNKENAKRAIHRMAKKGFDTEEQVWDGIL